MVGIVTDCWVCDRSFSTRRRPGGSRSGASCVVPATGRRSEQLSDQPQDGQSHRRDHTAVTAASGRSGHSKMNRRTFLAATIAALITPPAAGAQPAGRAYRVGLLGLASGSDAPVLASLRQGLRDLGYEEGKNLVIEYRTAEGKYDRLPALAVQLVGLKIDVFVTYGTPGALAAKQADDDDPSGRGAQ